MNPASGNGQAVLQSFGGLNKLLMYIYRETRCRKNDTMFSLGKYTYTRVAKLKRLGICIIYTYLCSEKNLYTHVC